MIIGFVQTKGGTGKSTLALNIAFSGVMAKAFDSIALVELDPQGTLKRWWQERAEMGYDCSRVSFHHLSSTQKSVFQEGIRSIARHNELMIMDIPGEGTGKLHTQFACAFCDVTVIPMRPSTNDESAFLDNLYPIIKNIVQAVPGKKGRFHVLPVFTHPQSGVNRHHVRFTQVLPPYVTCLKAVFPARSVYENFNRQGLNLNEYARVVSANRKLKAQAEKALADVRTISETLILAGNVK
jgi:cellulose biosynthesis protein BcsQ